MDRERSPEEFDGGDGDGNGDGDGGGSDAAAGRPADGGDAAATYRWAPGGEPCADCGERVERRWRDDGRYVCADCKEW